MPNRIIREGINSSPRINSLSSGAEVLYRRLMSACDDYGRFYASISAIRGACWPTHPSPPCEQDVSNWLTECTQPASNSKPLITLYEVAGCQYIQINDFNQKIRSKSKFPTPVDTLSASCPQVVDNLPALGGMRYAVCDMRSATAEAAPEAVTTVSELKQAIRNVSPPLKNGTHKKPEDRAAMERRLQLHENVRMMLMRYPGAQQLIGKPDDEVIGKCIAIAQRHPQVTEEESIHAALSEMLRGHKAPASSWMWFPTVIDAMLLEEK